MSRSEAILTCRCGCRFVLSSDLLDPPRGLWWLQIEVVKGCKQPCAGGAGLRVFVPQQANLV